MIQLNSDYYYNIKKSLYFEQQLEISSFYSSESWIVLTEIEQRIKSKIELIGTPLKDWDISIYRGILTGYNEAFIIDGKKKDELINEDPKSAEIIRPILRGRDVKRYNYEFADLWLINTHNGVKEKGLKSVDVAHYPAIKKHLDEYYIQLKKRTDKGDTPYNLRSCAYLEDFNKQKIVWKIIGDQLAFSIELDNFIVNNACYILTGNDLYYILAFLNSKIIKWYSYLTNMNKTGVGDMQIGAQNVIIFPIPLITKLSQKPIESLVKQLLDEKKTEKNTFVLEYKVDRLIFELYGLTYEEIEFIELQ